MKELFHPALCWAALHFENAEAVIRHMAQALVDQRFAYPSLIEAILSREAESPTGLPLSKKKVAIPHADPEHIVQPVMAMATMAEPVLFHEMGNPEHLLAVEVVVMLALADHDAAQGAMLSLIDKLQEESFVDELCLAPDPETLYKLMTRG